MPAGKESGPKGLGSERLHLTSRWITELCFEQCGHLGLAAAWGSQALFCLTLVFPRRDPSARQETCLFYCNYCVGSDIIVLSILVAIGHFPL